MTSSPWCLGNFGLHDGYVSGYSDCQFCSCSGNCMELTGDLYVPKEVIRIVKSFLNIELLANRRLSDNVE